MDNQHPLPLDRQRSSSDTRREPHDWQIKTALPARNTPRIEVGCASSTLSPLSHATTMINITQLLYCAVIIKPPTGVGVNTPYFLVITHCG